jgi:asparagine synthase (glutamine-hydrolysing)
VARCVDEIIALQDVPLRSSQVLSYYFLIQAAAQRQMKVMLDGQGADEYLAGYSPSHTYSMAGQLRRLRLLKAWKGLNSPACRRQGRRMFARKILNVALWGVRSQDRSASAGLRRSPDVELKAVGGSLLKRWLCRGLFTSPLPGLLHYQDRIAMHFSIENRVPFLTIGLVEFLLSLPEGFIIGENGESKRVFRAAMRGIVPDPVLDRHDKIGFTNSQTAWMSASNGWVEERMRDAASLALFSPGGLARLDSVRDSVFVWRICNLLEWARAFAVPLPLRAWPRPARARRAPAAAIGA